MLNIGFDFVQPDINIPTDLTSFKKRPQVRWTANDWNYQSSVYVGYGATSGTWTSTTNFSTPKKKDLYTSSQNDGLRVRAVGYGNQHEALYMMEGNSRWMPASVFNGVGFETYYYIESSNSNHQIYVGAYGVVFKNRTGTGQRIFGWDTGNSDGPGHDKYRFDRIYTSMSDVNTIRTWGSNWLFQGLLVSIKCKGSGTGTTTSYIDLYNLKVGSKYSLTGSGYKVHPLALRPYSGRNQHPLEENKFAYFKKSLF